MSDPASDKNDGTELTEEQLQTLARRLDARREELLASLRRHLARSRRDNDAGLDGVGDEADQAFAEVLHDTDNAALRRDNGELALVDAARQRMAKDEYGVCKTCGDPIAFARLLAQPAAVRCVRCQNLHEKTYAPPDAAAP